MTMQLHSERFSPDGNLSAEGYENLMGTPSLDLLAVLVREATQNACDAMTSPNGGKLRWRIRQLSTDQVSILKEQVFISLPEEKKAKSKLQDFFKNRRLQWALEIMDSGTTGLGGPTRADQQPVDGENPDFVNFFKNIGAARDVENGGGTYGFGKATLYRASRCHTIIVDTMTSQNNHEERRLLVAQLGKAVPGKYTGRHWWGIAAHDNATADPLVNDAATTIADALGFLPRALGERGTSIMILSPHFIDPEAPNPENLANAIEETLLWYFWPRMMKTTEPKRRLHCEIWKNNKFEPATPPERFPPLNLFAKAMNNLRGISETESDQPVHDIASKRPKQQLGQLTIVHEKRSRRRWLLPSADMHQPENYKGLTSIIPTKCHHLALMRPIELVVKYMEGGMSEDEDEEWAGVFRCDDEKEVENAFVRSEPPAHDDWKPSFLPQRSREKTFVTVALREIKKLLPSQFDPKNPAEFKGSTTPLGKIADKLGVFLATTSGQGAGKRRTVPHGSGGRRKPAAVTSPQFVGLEENRNRAIAIFGFAVHTSDGILISIEASPKVIIEGRAEDPDETTGFPQIVEWLAADGSNLGNEHNILDLNEGKYRIKVRMPGATAIGLKLAIVDTERKET